MVCVWKLTGVVLEQLGIIQPDTSVILALVVSAFMSGNGFSFGDGGAAAMMMRDTNADPGNNVEFIEAPLRVYTIMQNISVALEVVAFGVLCISVWLLHKHPLLRAYHARRLMLVAWLIVVFSNMLPLLLPYSQLVPRPDCPTTDQGSDCTPAELATIWAVEKQIVGVVFSILSTIESLPTIIVIIPVWVRVSKLLVAQRNDIGQMLYYSSFVLFASLATIASFAGIMQAVGLWSFASSMLIIWLFSSIHLTPVSSYKAWFHFVGSFYLSMLMLVVWFALVTPLGCNLLSLFSTNGIIEQPAWRTVYRTFAVIIGALEFVSHIFLANIGIWHFFEWALAVLVSGKHDVQQRKQLLQDLSSSENHEN